MLRESSLTVFLVATVMLTLPCTGFTAVRSVNVPITWNVAPTFDIEQKAVTVDHASSARTESANTDKGLQILDVKKSTKSVEQTSPSDLTPARRFEFRLENAEDKSRSTKAKDENLVKENVATDSVASTPRNIVLIITEPSENQDDFWKYVKASRLFPAEGFLQSGSNVQSDATRFFLDNALAKASQSRKRDCEHFLRANIAVLLLWTRDVKGMTTGTLSNANFTIPSLFGYEESVGLSKEFDDVNENNMKPEVQKLKPEIRSDWRVIDFERPNYRNPFVSNTRDEDEAAWNAFDMYSKMRLVLFRSLLESLSGNATATEDNSAPSRKSHLLRSNLVDLLEELKSVENEKGYILVASVGVSELNSALGLLQREASQDTLVVVTGVCSLDAKPVPLAAQGPSAKMLQEATTIWDVPTVIKNIIASGCQDANCKTRQHDIFELSVPPVKIVPHNVAISRRSARDAAGTLAAKKVDTSVVKDDVKKDANSISLEKTGKSGDNETEAKADRSNFGNSNRAEKFSTIFNTMVSITAAFVLTS